MPLCHTDANDEFMLLSITSGELSLSLYDQTKLKILTSPSTDSAKEAYPGIFHDTLVILVVQI